MWGSKVLQVVLRLQTAANTSFVTNPDTGVSYQGTSADGVDQFQSIFYAEDTSGANRFAPPVPYLPTNGTTVQATAKGDACPQLATGNPMYPFDTQFRNTSENCLSLRIARPANQTSDKPLPVMVYFHGGGLVFGSAYDRVYNPVGLIQESVASGHPVMWVGVNYRLGLFGYAASPELEDAKSENVGLRDQRLALQWVKDNIAAFGGDPDNITVFGESVGGTSIAVQITAFGGQQGAVFTKAIIDSGSLNVNFSTTYPFLYTANVTKTLNCTTLACLRSLPLETLLPTALEQASKLAPPYGIGLIHPVIDGDFIPSKPAGLISNGSFVKGISLIVFWNEDDGSQFIPSSVNNETAVEDLFGRQYGNSTRDQLLPLYPVEDFEAQAQAPEVKNSTMTAQYYRASRIQRDHNFACPSFNLTYEFSRQSTNQTYLWTLNTTRYQAIWDAENYSEWQIAHTSDIPFLYNDDNIIGGDNSESAMDLSAKVSRSLSAFATFGNPSTPDFDWPVAWSGEDRGNATVFVVGGPYGFGPASLEPANTSDATLYYLRSEALAQEKLVERCALINSIGPPVVWTADDPGTKHHCTE